MITWAFVSAGATLVLSLQTFQNQIFICHKCHHWHKVMNDFIGSLTASILAIKKEKKITKSARGQTLLVSGELFENVLFFDRT